MGKHVRIFFSLLLMMIAGMMMPFFSSAQSENATVHFIPVEQTVESGLEAFLDRSIMEATEDGADHIILEIDTPGGAVDAAGNIADIIQTADVPITAFVTDDALSAGAYIALNADNIVMAPGAQIGSAAVVDTSGNTAGNKAQSVWESNMATAAQNNDRDPVYAEAMTDPEDPLTMNAEKALDVGYTEEVVTDREEVLAFLGLEDAEQVESEVSLAEQLTRWVTNPMIIPILLTLGGVGLIMELFTPGFGLPGLVGLGSLGLFFFGHLFAGFAGMEAIILLILGLILIVVETVFTGFGIALILGLASIVGSIFLASFDTTQILTSVLIALILIVMATMLLFKYFGKIGFMQKLVLQNAAAESAEDDLMEEDELVGKIGRSLTPLRPAGLMVLLGEHYDVVTDGAYVETGRDVRVISVSGTRIVVRAVN